jgi:hypothetical protein
MPPATNYENSLRLFEDIASLKTAVSSIAAQLEDFRRQGHDIRDGLTDLQVQVQRIDQRLETVEGRVASMDGQIDRLIVWRSSTGGMLAAAGFLFAMIFHMPEGLTRKVVDYFSGK